MRDVKAIVRRIASLKPFPKALYPIMQMMQDPDVDTDRLADAIACDASLTANLLKGANSAYYGRPGKFETVSQAVVFLGTAEVFNLVMMAGCRETLAGRQVGYDLGDGDLFAYSLNSALLARAVATRTTLPDSKLVFTAGILKDIGKMVLSQHVAEEYRRIRAMVDGGSSFREAERAVLGIDHAELGAMVAAVWQFSEKMVAMIRHHHTPLACESAPDETAAVYLGDVLCMMLGTGGGADGLAYRFDRRVIDRLGLSDVDIQMLLVDFQEQMDRIQGMPGVGQTSDAHH